MNMKKLLTEWRKFLKESQEFDEEEMVNALNKNGRDFYGLIDDLNASIVTGKLPPHC